MRLVVDFLEPDVLLIIAVMTRSSRDRLLRGDLTMATTRIQIGPADHGRRMTLDEFREAEEEPGYRYELARGVLEVTEVPNDPHGQIVDNLREASAATGNSTPA